MKYDHGNGICGLCNNKSITWGTRNYENANHSVHSGHRLYELRCSYCYMFRKDIPSTTRGSHCYFLFAQDRLLVTAGYEWDGATWGVQTKNSFRGTLVHDALYHSMRDGILPQCVRRWADDEFYYMLRDDGMSWLRARTWWALCRLGGWYYTKFAVTPPRAWPVRFL
ncbi:MAG: hypothetical protein OXE53_12865 [Deltaproteobacteria bacterium]|nr:hypothetical protein [Deltaproteobacteria bacterium]